MVRMSLFRRRKKRVVVLLGAGSTIHANAPSTADVTAHVVGLRNPVVEAWSRASQINGALMGSTSNTSFMPLKSSIATFFGNDTRADRTCLAAS